MRIVHLSDIHLSKDDLKDFNYFTKGALLEDLVEFNLEKKIDLILITGDLVDKGGNSFGNIETAFKAFEENVINPIRRNIQIGKNRIFFTPGNHDINDDADSPISEIGLTGMLKSTDILNKFIDKNETEGMKRILPYKEFEKNFCTDDFMSKSITNFQSSYVLEIDGKKVGINCLNTAWRCHHSKGDEEKILLGERQVVEGHEIITDCDVKIALMHHHKDLLEDFDKESVDSIIQRCYDAVFCGHVHKASSWRNTNSYGDIFVSVSQSNWVGNIRSTDMTYLNGYSIVDYNVDSGEILVNYRSYNKNSNTYVKNTFLGDKGENKFNVNNKRNKKKKLI